MSHRNQISGWWSYIKAGMSNHFQEFTEKISRTVENSMEAGTKVVPATLMKDNI
jgi:hypothetical protein